MPFSHSVSADEETAYVTAEPPVDLWEVMEAVRDVQADPSFDPHYKVLVDLRETRYSPAEDDIKAIGAALGEMKRAYGNRIAVVVSGALNFCLARMAVHYAEAAGFRMRAFNDLGAAKAWLAEATRHAAERS